MLRKPIPISFLLAVVAVPVTAADTKIMTGKVVSIADGDTLTLLVDRRQTKIRLEGIDAPEKGQPYGDEAKQELGRLMFGKAVKVATTGKDRYGRTLGRVFIGDTDVNVHLVRQGLAWWSRKYPDDPNPKAPEDAARREGRGRWADPSPVAPWDWQVQHLDKERP